MMKKTIYPLVAVLLILACCCCKTSKKGVSNGNYPLIGTQWNLTALEGEEIGTDFALRPFITFDSVGNITGNLGCNTFFGTYSVNKKQKMTIEFQGATKRLCQQMSVERRFIKALKQDIVRYKIHDNELILLAADDLEIMRFTGVDLGNVE
jgi:putative lipoprotein